MDNLILPSHEDWTRHIVKFDKSLKVHETYYKRQLEQIFKDEWGEYNAYLCPLCLHNMLICTDRKLYGSSSFNMDHFPQKSIGGRNRLLICEPCNNSAGYIFEPEILAFMERLSFNQNVQNTDVSAKGEIILLDGVQLQGARKIKVIADGKGGIAVDFGHVGRIQNSSEFIDNFKKHWKEWNLSLTFNKPDNTKLTRSLIKSAFLYCFDLWGYDFAFSLTARQMVRVIGGQLDYPVINAALYIATEQLDQVPIGVCAAEISGKPTIVVNIPLKLERTRFTAIAGIPIAMPSKEGWGELSKLKVETDFNVQKFMPVDLNRHPQPFTTIASDMKLS